MPFQADTATPGEHGDKSACTREQSNAAAQHRHLGVGTTLAFSPVSRASRRSKPYSEQRRDSSMESRARAEKPSVPETVTASTDTNATPAIPTHRSGPDVSRRGLEPRGRFGRLIDGLTRQGTAGPAIGRFEPSVGICGGNGSQIQHGRCRQRFAAASESQDHCRSRDRRPGRHRRYRKRCRHPDGPGSAYRFPKCDPAF